MRGSRLAPADDDARPRSCGAHRPEEPRRRAGRGDPLRRGAPPMWRRRADDRTRGRRGGVDPALDCTEREPAQAGARAAGRARPRCWLRDRLHTHAARVGVSRAADWRVGFDGLSEAGDAKNGATMLRIPSASKRRERGRPAAVALGRAGYVTPSLLSRDAAASSPAADSGRCIRRDGAAGSPDARARPPRTDRPAAPR